MQLVKNPKLLSRQEIIDGFHRVYLAKIEKATRDKGGIIRPGAQIPMEKLKDIYNEALADYVQGLLQLLP